MVKICCKRMDEALQNGAIKMDWRYNAFHIGKYMDIYYCPFCAEKIVIEKSTEDDDDE